MFRLFNVRFLSVCFVMAAATRAAAAAAQEPAAEQPIARAKFLTDMNSEFGKMDVDRNGSVSRTELERFRQAAAATEAQSRNQALFATLDSDRNGQISQAEFAKLVAPPATPDVSLAMAKFDLNKDKAITLIEYRTGTLDNFDRLDTDKDGYVSTAELRAGGIGN